MSKGFVEAVDKGLLGQVLNFAVEKGFGLPWLVNKAAEVTEGFVAGASGIIDKVASLPISNPISATLDPTPINPPKLGRGAADAIERARIDALPVGPETENRGNIGQLASQFVNAAPQRNLDGALLGQG